MVVVVWCQIVGSAVLGSLLDRLRSPTSRRQGSRGLLAFLSVLGLAASATAMALEGPHRHNRTVRHTDTGLSACLHEGHAARSAGQPDLLLVVVQVAARDYRSLSVVVPSLAFAMWGLLGA